MDFVIRLSRFIILFSIFFIVTITYILGTVRLTEYLHPSSLQNKDTVPVTTTNPQNMTIPQSQIAHLKGLPTRVQVTKVLDGDTVQVTTRDKYKTQYKVRLLCIDAPENNQEPYGLEAKTFLEHLILNKSIRLVYEKQTKDMYGRLLAYVVTNNNVIANLEMIRSGNAVLFMMKKSYLYYEDFTDASDYAKKNRLGIFYNSTTPLQVLPEDYRKQKKTKKPQ